MVIDARDAEALEKTAAELEGLGGTVTALAGDVNDPAHRQALVEAVGERSLDLLVNNASSLGPSPLPSLTELPPECLSEVFATNAVAPLALVQVGRYGFAAVVSAQDRERYLRRVSRALPWMGRLRGVQGGPRSAGGGTGR